MNPDYVGRPNRTAVQKLLDFVPHFSRRALVYAALFAARIFTQRALCAAAIFLRAVADIVRFTSDESVVLATGLDLLRIFAQRAFCASAILRREAADMIRVGCAVLLGTAAPLPFKDSIPEMI
jgi:hypothetical protein